MRRVLTVSHACVDRANRAVWLGIGLLLMPVRNEYAVQMGAQQTLRGVMAIVGPIGATVAFQHLGPSAPFYMAASVVAVAALVAWHVRDERAAPAPAVV